MKLKTGFKVIYHVHSNIIPLSHQVFYFNKSLGSRLKWNLFEHLRIVFVEDGLKTLRNGHKMFQIVQQIDAKLKFMLNIINGPKLSSKHVHGTVPLTFQNWKDQLYYFISKIIYWNHMRNFILMEQKIKLKSSELTFKNNLADLNLVVRYKHLVIADLSY